jgi:hypothetical protein
MNHHNDDPRSLQGCGAQCQGGDCVAQEAGNDWFGDLAVSVESEESSRDAYGDRV